MNVSGFVGSKQMRQIFFFGLLLLLVD